MEVRSLTMPKWGLSMEEGTVTKWLIDEGAQFAEGDEIVEIETDKIANIVEAPFSGRLARIVAGPGTTLPVGAVIAVSAPVDAADAEVSRAAASLAKDVQPDTPSVKQASDPVHVESPSAPKARLLEIIKVDDDGDAIATLHAKKFARTHGVNLSKIRGTGRRGRISRADVESAMRAAGMSVAGAPLKPEQARPNNAPSVAAPKIADGAPLSSMRRTIARRLQQSKQNAPHYRVVADCEIDELLRLRERLNATAPDGVKLSINDLIIKACAVALIAVPNCNVQFDGESVLQLPHADITVAVALPQGLITPKIVRADQKGLVEISAEMKELVARAQAGKLLPEEYQGGSFTISNLGMYGIESFSAIINPPQASILAVGAGARRYLPGDEGPRLITEMTLCLSCDHRIIDGALAARFIEQIKRNLENPLFMLA